MTDIKRCTEQLPYDQSALQGGGICNGELKEICETTYKLKHIPEGMECHMQHLYQCPKCKTIIAL